MEDCQGRSEVSKTTFEEDPPSRIVSIRKAYLDALLAGNRKMALQVVRDAQGEGIPVLDLYVDVFQEAMYEVGRLWEANVITVADEHMATAITQYILSVLYQEMDVRNEPKGRAVITGIQGELHQIGANMVADVLESDGWNVRFLGTNVPADGVLEAVVDHKAELFGVSVTMFFHLPHVIELIRRLKEEVSDIRPRVILGGAAFRMLPGLPTELDGCDVAKDLREALQKSRSIACTAG